jgi:hypothetical protein
MKEPKHCLSFIFPARHRSVSSTVAFSKLVMEAVDSDGQAMNPLAQRERLSRLLLCRGEFACRFAPQDLHSPAALPAAERPLLPGILSSQSLGMSLPGLSWRLSQVREWEEQ